VNIVFLNPYLLFGILAAAIPVVLHLLSRQRSRRIPFSALFLLRRVDVKTAQRHKLVDILLLLLRTILILLLALALARPVWRPKGAPATATGNALRVILLDDSLSSNLIFREKTVFEQERVLTETAIKTLQSEDVALLMTSSGGQWPKSFSPTLNSSLLLNALDKLKPSCSARGLIPSLNQIVSLPAESQKSTCEIIIITDMQKFAFEGSLETGKLLKLQPHIYLCPVETPEKTDNLAIAKTTVQTSLPFPGFPVYIEYQIVNHSTEPRDTLIRLWNDKNILEQKKQTVSGNSSLSGNFTFIPVSADYRTGKIDLEPDNLPEDNGFFFNLPLLDGVKILVISAPGMESLEKDGSLFLSIALDPLEGTGNTESIYRAQNISLERLETINLNEYSLLFFLNIYEWNDAIIPRIEEYIKSGGAAFFFHGSPLVNPNPAEPPPSLKTIIPFRLERLRSEKDPEQPDAIGECDPDHPIVKALKKIPRLDFSSAHFYKTWNIRIPLEGAAFHAIMKTKDASPLLIEKNIGKGKVLHFLSGIDPDASDLGTRPFFIPFLFETIKYLLSGQTAKYGISGEPITLEYDDSEMEKVAYEVTTPDGRKIGMDWEQETLRFPGNDTPGNYIYKPKTGNRDQERFFSINIDPREGDLARISIREIEKMFPDSLPVSICNSPLELEKALNRNRSGKPLSFHLFFAAFIVFFLEILFANLLLVRRENEPRKDL
jgi:hypothetical protein